MVMGTSGYQPRAQNAEIRVAVFGLSREDTLFSQTIIRCNKVLHFTHLTKSTNQQEANTY